MSISYSPHLEIQISGKAVYLTIHALSLNVKINNNSNTKANTLKTFAAPGALYPGSSSRAWISTEKQTHHKTTLQHALNNFPSVFYR